MRFAIIIRVLKRSKATVPRFAEIKRCRLRIRLQRNESSDMTILDFNELSDPDSRSPPGEDFEGLIRELGKQLGLRPDWTGRGSDQGRDLFFTEQRGGALGLSEVRWLVSCKDKARSGRSVTEQDAGSISDKLRQHKAHGFLLATTTTASTGLKAMLDGINVDGTFTTVVWDKHELENLLLKETHVDLVKRYLPSSYAAYRRLSGIPQALDSLSLLMPGAIFQKIKTVIEAYHTGGAWLTAELIWPHDQVSMKTIDLAVSALLERNDATEAANILSSDEIEFDAYVATLKSLASVRPAESKDLCRALVRNGSPNGLALNAFQLFVQHFEPSNEEQITLAVELAEEDLLELYSGEITAYVSEELSRNPETYRAWDDLDVLSSSTRLKYCELDTISFCPIKDNARIGFVAQLTVTAELTYDREDGGSYSCPGTATGYFDPYGIYIEDFTVDTSSFYE
jgi:hypothetical protein